jgi:2-polyprenyl-3-methyl-5-hydroxy-6-metoxy-1,4-benzoquinol methylase
VSTRVLDAGCGRKCDPSIPDDAYVVGVDIDPDGLALNGRLDEAVVADLGTASLPGLFDLIVCNDVLEHLTDPYSALDNLAGALAPGGRMILGLPNVFSFKALLTKWTPLSLHIWAARRLGYEHAGEPGHGPFKTYLRMSLRRRRLLHWASERGLTARVEYWNTPLLPWPLSHRSEIRVLLTRSAQ